MRGLLLLAAAAALTGCGSDDTTEAAPEEPSSAAATTTVTDETTEAPATPEPTRDRATEAYLRQYLPGGMGSYYAEIASITATSEKVTIRTKTSDANFLYRGACQTALDLAAERGVTNVEVLDAQGNVKSASNGSTQCDKRY